MKKVCICGGGALGHVIAGFLSAKHKAEVNLLTSKPACFSGSLTINTPSNDELTGKLSVVSSRPEEAVPDADVVLFCLPGFLIADELRQVKPYLKPDAYVGSVFSSTGFFFEALKILPEKQPLWGFQRVPFISRVADYGKTANLLRYKNRYHIAVEHVTPKDAEVFRVWVETAFERPTCLLKNYLEASLTNSNPILHTSRLYSLFADWTEEKRFPHNILFYEEWDEKSAGLLIKMDEEFFRLLDVLPVTKGFLPGILEYYESGDAKSLAAKLSGIEGFKGIYSPMKEVDGGWIPDFESRYFTEDFPYGLRYIWHLAHEKGIDVPCIDKVYAWGMDKINKQ